MAENELSPEELRAKYSVPEAPATGVDQSMTLQNRIAADLAATPQPGNDGANAGPVNFDANLGQTRPSMDTKFGGLRENQA